MIQGVNEWSFPNIKPMYLFSSFTDTIRNPMKIGCADGGCSHLNHVLTASSASDSACSEQLQANIIRNIP